MSVLYCRTTLSTLGYLGNYPRVASISIHPFIKPVSGEISSRARRALLLAATRYDQPRKAGQPISQSVRPPASAPDRQSKTNDYPRSSRVDDDDGDDAGGDVDGDWGGNERGASLAG